MPISYKTILGDFRDHDLASVDVEVITFFSEQLLAPVYENCLTGTNTSENLSFIQLSLLFLILNWMFLKKNLVVLAFSLFVHLFFIQFKESEA